MKELIEKSKFVNFIDIMKEVQELVNDETIKIKSYYIQVEGDRKEIYRWESDCNTFVKTISMTGGVEGIEDNYVMLELMKLKVKIVDREIIDTLRVPKIPSDIREMMERIVANSLMDIISSKRVDNPLLSTKDSIWLDINDSKSKNKINPQWLNEYGMELYYSVEFILNSINDSVSQMLKTWESDTK